MSYDAPDKASVWHGSVTSLQSTTWNGTSMTNTTKYGYSYIDTASSLARPYRIGGDEGIQTATTNDLASGGGLAWLRRSSGTTNTYSISASIGVGGNVTYSTGSSDSDYDIMDMNGDGLPDLVKYDGTVYLNMGNGNGFSPASMTWNGLSSSIRTFYNVGLSFTGSNGSVVMSHDLKVPTAALASAWAPRIRNGISSI
jgi:hypothetical protein